MKRKTSLLLTITTLVLSLFTIQNIWAQKELELEEEERYVSIRHEQTDFYEDFGTETEEAYDSVNFNVLDYIKTNLAPHRSYKAEKCHLSKEIYGYHPYWFGASYYNQYDYNLLSTFIYFSYELDYNTGGYKSIHSWKTTNSINLAKKAGCKVELCVSNFGGYRNNKFLSNRKAWARLATNLIALLDYRDADGINLDFENVRSGDKDKLTNFVIYLNGRFEKERPGTSISIAVPGLNNYNTYDIAAMGDYVSKVIIMAYDYHYSSSKHAGAVAPLDGYLSLKTTLNNYLASGVDASKFIMAVPYYGREWKTRSSGVPATTSSYVKAPTYTHIKNSYYPNYTVKWDDKSATHYVVRKVSGTIRQCWFDSEESLGRKYDLALENDIGGVGMWALGYDHGHHDLWDLLEDKFTQCRDEEYQDISTQEEPKPLYQRIIEDYFDYDN